MHYEKKTCQQMQCDALDNVCWASLGPGIYVEVTLTGTTYLNMLQTKYTSSSQQYYLMAWFGPNSSDWAWKVGQTTQIHWEPNFTSYMT